MASIVQLKRSALSGKVPDTGSLNLGELAVNTYDGKIYFKKSGSIESVESVLTTNSVVTGSIRLEGTGSFGSLRVNDTLTINHGEAIVSGSALVTSDLTVLGAVNARQFNISVISSSVLFESGSSNFGNSLDDTHTFTGSVNITGSFLLNGESVGGGTTTGSFTGSFTGDGSGLRGVVSDDIPRDGWDYNTNSSASINDFNNTSDKYLIDFEQSQSTAVGTPVGFKGFMTNVSGSTQILPTLDSIDFIVRDTLVASIGVGGIVATAPAGTISGSSQLTSSYDTRYVLSGSITQTTWDNIASKPDGIVSGSSQVIEILTPLNSKTGSYATTGSNTFVGTQTHSGSIIPAIDNTYDLGSLEHQWRDIFVSSGSLYIDGTKVLGSTGDELQITTDAGQSIKILEAGSDNIILQSADGDIQLKSSGGGNLLFDPTTGLIDVRGTLQIQDGNKITSSGGNSIVFGDNIVISGSIQSTGNVNGVNLTTFSSSIATQISTIQTNTGSSNERLTSIENKTGSLATTGSNTFFGTQTFSGSVYIANDLIVQGSSSIQYISASSVSIGTNIIQLNTANPSVRYAGLSIIDSGSIGGSGSFLYDSVQDEFIFIHRGNGTNVTSSHFVQGPQTYDDLGNEIYLTNNRLTKGTGLEHIVDSNITDTGTLITLGSNTTITGTLLATETPLVSGSSQVSFTGIVDKPTLVSGSSQITLSSTTGYGSVLNQAVLTTSSPTFAGVTINGVLSGSNATFSNGVTAQNIYSISDNGEQIVIKTTTDNNKQLLIGRTSTYASITAITQGVGYVPLLLNPSGGNVGFGLTNPQSQVHLNGTLTFTEAAFDTVRRHTITHGHSDGNNVNNYVAINVSNGTGTTAERIRVNGSGQVLPGANGTQDLGSTSLRWANIYTNDLHLSNEDKVGGNDVDGTTGNWTIQEGEEHLYIINNKTGKKFKFSLEEIQ